MSTGIGGAMSWLFVRYAEVGALGFGRGVAVSSAILVRCSADVRQVVNDRVVDN